MSGEAKKPPLQKKIMLHKLDAVFDFIYISTDYTPMTKSIWFPPFYNISQSINSFINFFWRNVHIIRITTKSQT